MPRPGGITDDPEQAVLVAAVRDERPLPPIRDEIRLAAVASWHRVEGLLARALAEHDLGSTDLRDHLEQARTATETRYATLRARLVELVEAWADAGLTATLLKGAALVESGVVPPGERPMADLDVLVASSDARRAHAIASDVGFRSSSSRSTWEYATTRHHHLPALVDDHGTTVEVHHRLLDGSHPQRRLDDFARGRRIPLEGPSLAPAGRAGAPGTGHLAVGRLDDVATWLHLAVHFWDDRRRGTGGVLLQLRDLAVLSERIEADDLADAALATGAGRLVATVGSVLWVVCRSPAGADLRRTLCGPPPDDAFVTRYVQTRILGRRSPLAQLVHPTVSVAYTPWRLVTRARHQLWPGSDQLHQVHGPEASRRDHWVSLAPVVRDAVGSPGVVWQDLRLDHWAHEVGRAVDGGQRHRAQRPRQPPGERSR